MSITKQTSVSAEYLIKVDEASSTVTYIGDAKPGASTSDAVWRIIKITESGDATSLEYADSDTFFNNIWDNRESLSYG